MPPSVGGVVASTVTLARLEQALNEFSPIVLILLGIVTLANPAQPLKALLLMDVRPVPIVTLERLVLFWNTLSPILVTLLGIVTDVSDEQLLNV